MRIPVWLTLGVAVVVILFGAYRIYIATRPADEDAKPKSRLYQMSKRTHLFVGVIYLLLGAGLIATSFGWNPFGNHIGPDTEKPSPDKAPAKSSTVPIDQLPNK